MRGQGTDRRAVGASSKMGSVRLAPSDEGISQEFLLFFPVCSWQKVVLKRFYSTGGTVK